jgi:hypothetical protein
MPASQAGSSGGSSSRFAAFAGNLQQTDTRTPRNASPWREREQETRRCKLLQMPLFVLRSPLIKATLGESHPLRAAGTASVAAGPGPRHAEEKIRTKQLRFFISRAGKQVGTGKSRRMSD